MAEEGMLLITLGF